MGARRSPVDCRNRGQRARCGQPQRNATQTHFCGVLPETGGLGRDSCPCSFRAAGDEPGAGIVISLPFRPGRCLIRVVSKVLRESLEAKGLQISSLGPTVDPSSGPGTVITAALKSGGPRSPNIFIRNFKRRRAMLRKNRLCQVRTGRQGSGVGPSHCKFHILFKAIAQTAHGSLYLTTFSTVASDPDCTLETS